jgi:acetolactate synthase I/II/III large subunit
MATIKPPAKSPSRSEQTTLAVSNTAQAYLSLLGARGIDYFFANGGTDFAPIIDAYARALDEGR